jgi:hypothetical protein
MQRRNRGDARSAHEVREDTSPPEAQSVDKRTTENGPEQPDGRSTAISRTPFAPAA